MILVEHDLPHYEDAQEMTEYVPLDMGGRPRRLQCCSTRRGPIRSWRS